MKRPNIILEWQCDGIACNKAVQVEISADQFQPELLTESGLAKIVDAGGCRVLGRNTFFCPRCSDRGGRKFRGLPDSSAIATTGPGWGAGDESAKGVCPEPPAGTLITDGVGA